MALHTRLSMLAIGALAATTATAQHVLLPFSQHTSSDINLSARGSKQTTLTSSEYAYVIDATVGTPPQKVSLLISTSVGDTWVPDANTRECSPEWYYRDQYGYDDEDLQDFNVPEPQCTWGSFNKTRSSTYLPPNSRYDGFSDTYIDSSSVSGANMTDKLAFGGLEFNDYPMGLVSNAYRWIGILGLGANNSADYYSSASAGDYANVVDRMVSSGKIASHAYSIWLDNAKGTSGGLLFGAVDRSRYTGDLVRVSSSSSYYSYGFVTTLNSINGTAASGDAMPPIRSNDFPVDVTIGPGEVFSFLPARLADQIADMAGATYNESAEVFLIPCDAGKTNNTKFVFELGGADGPKLNAETADLVLPMTSFAGYQRYRLLGSDMCMFGIQKYDESSYSSSSYSSSSSYVYNLGSSLLRRSYIVFDLANREIALAQAKFPSGSNAPASDIVAFENYGDYTPGASELCTRSYCRASDGGSGSGSGSDSGSGGPYKYGGPENGVQHWEKVAIGVGVTFGVLILAGVITGIILCTRSGRRKVVAKEVDEEGLGSDTPPATSTNPEMTQNTRGSMILPPGPLPSIQEGAEPHAQTHTPAPQLPALGTQLAQSITPPEPTASANSNRPSVAVSALSQEQETQTYGSAPESEAAAPASPKGKGKAVDRDED
ncbi:aspartic peptidase domain-containing protein [Chaetomium tenue]|uniref:Aspartic peptidase domain-containing protein n=1 Tax=Chaetomium tenue TaxID=1854479 RepID=A0ACB7PFF8_9PEZI|nr:aspartic peptidase domain-containing protein [Chaetomium globosum]